MSTLCDNVACRKTSVFSVAHVTGKSFITILCSECYYSLHKRKANIFSRELTGTWK